MEQIYSQVFWEGQGNSLCVVPKEVQGRSHSGDQLGCQVTKEPPLSSLEEI